MPLIETGAVKRPPGIMSRCRLATFQWASTTFRIYHLFYNAWLYHCDIFFHTVSKWSPENKTKNFFFSSSSFSSDVIWVLGWMQFDGKNTVGYPPHTHTRSFVACIPWISSSQWRQPFLNSLLNIWSLWCCTPAEQEERGIKQFLCPSYLLDNTVLY